MFLISGITSRGSRTSIDRAHSWQTWSTQTKHIHVRGWPRVRRVMAGNFTAHLAKFIKKMESKWLKLNELVWFTGMEGGGGGGGEFYYQPKLFRGSAHFSACKFGQLLYFGQPPRGRFVARPRHYTNDNCQLCDFNCHHEHKFRTSSPSVGNLHLKWPAGGCISVGDGGEGWNLVSSGLI